MSFPDIESAVSTPGQLAALLRETKECLAKGVLRQVKPTSAPLALDDLWTVSDDGPWPDFIEAYFEDRQGKLYKLAVETHHGAGGTWGPA